MKQRHVTFTLLGTLITTTAWALVAAPAPLPFRVAQADTIVVGKVVSFEVDDAAAKPFPGAKEKSPFRIAIVEVQDKIKGSDAKKIRIGFIAPKLNPKVPINSSNRPLVNIGQEGVFFLKKHFDGDFYQAPQFGTFMPKQQLNLATELAAIRKIVDLEANPAKGLEAKNPEDRLLAAAILVGKYRTRSGGAVKEEPIDAAQSKLILKVIADADWKSAPRSQITPMYVFNMLGIGPNDGFTRPRVIRSTEDFGRAVQDWIKTNGGKYQIKRFVEIDP